MRERIEFLDTIRGLSIIGILFVNITSFSWPDLYDSVPSEYWSSPLDRFLHSLIAVLVQGSFYPVFAVLFGISMGFIFNGALKRGLNPYFVFSRRLLFLLTIGLTHAFFVWHGDILTMYAILGFLLLPFYRVRTKRIFITAAAIWIIPNVFYALFLFFTNFKLTPMENTDVIKQVIQNYQNGFLSGVEQNYNDWHNIYTAINIPFLFISIFPLLLFGLGIAKSGWLTRTDELARKIDILWIVFGISGFTLKLLTIFQPTSLLALHVDEAFGGPLVGFFYALTVIKIYVNSRHSRHGRHLSRMNGHLTTIGKMSLSNYLFQSLMGLLIFKVLGLYGKVPPLLTLLTAFSIVLLQIQFSRIWLKVNTQGPVEQVWRRVTYLKRAKDKSLKVS